MTAVAKDPTETDRQHLVDELSEDLDVAIREFLERNPRTGSPAIRKAIRLAGRRADGGALRRAAPFFAVLAALVLGFVLGLWLG
jgi:hypothetical protein